MLLKWKMKKHDLTVTLTNITHVDGEEVVKFLQDTLDCLFEILNTTSELYQEPVFNALVSAATYIYLMPRGAVVGKGECW